MRATPRTKTNYPGLSFYNELPEQFQGLEVIDRKPMITNWEWINETWFTKMGLKFESFYQCQTSVFLCSGKVWEGMPVAKTGYWPDDKIIPFEHVKIERIPYYDVIYKLRYNGQEFTAGSVAWGDNQPLPEIIGYIVKRGYDDVAHYIGDKSNTAPALN